MKRLYQKQWHGIPFSSFTEISSKKLADSEFYDKYYREFFKKYNDFNEIDQWWQDLKNHAANWLSKKFPEGSCVLSVGCGLGYIEQKIWKEQQNKIDLHVTDFASDSLRWIQNILPEENIHIAMEEKNIPESKYDIIYFSGVDYALEDNNMIELLNKYKNYLTEDGLLLLISFSFHDEDNSIKNLAKEFIKSILHSVGLYTKGQFWGWERNQKDYFNLMYHSGFSSIHDGFIEPGHVYWIEGKPS